jgi:nucleotide-binding universal stress UspA family protein
MEAKKILVGIDFDPSSDRALEQAMMLARALGATLELAHVEQLPPATPAELMAREQSDLAALEVKRRQLEEVRQRVEAVGITAHIHAAVGAVVFGLIDIIDHVKPDLVVLGSHGRGAIKRALVGSVAESVVRRSPVPVVVVPPAWRAQLAAGAAWACADCGHMLAPGDSRERCRHCGHAPARWISAPLSSEPVDAGEAAVGEVEREEVGAGQSNPTSLFATSPGGTEGYDVNPELKIRY